MLVHQKIVINFRRISPMNENLLIYCFKMYEFTCGFCTKTHHSLRQTKLYANVTLFAKVNLILRNFTAAPSAETLASYQIQRSQIFPSHKATL